MDIEQAIEQVMQGRDPHEVIDEGLFSGIGNKIARAAVVDQAKRHNKRAAKQWAKGAAQREALLKKRELA